MYKYIFAKIYTAKLESFNDMTSSYTFPLCVSTFNAKCKSYIIIFAFTLKFDACDLNLFYSESASWR